MITMFGVWPAIPAAECCKAPHHSLDALIALDHAPPVTVGLAVVDMTHRSSKDVTRPRVHRNKRREQTTLISSKYLRGCGGCMEERNSYGERVVVQWIENT